TPPSVRPLHGLGARAAQRLAEARDERDRALHRHLAREAEELPLAGRAVREERALLVARVAVVVEPIDVAVALRRGRIRLLRLARVQRLALVLLHLAQAERAAVDTGGAAAETVRSELLAHDRVDLGRGRVDPIGQQVAAAGRTLPAGRWNGFDHRAGDAPGARLDVERAREALALERVLQAIDDRVDGRVVSVVRIAARIRRLRDLRADRRDDRVLGQAAVGAEHLEDARAGIGLGVRLRGALAERAIGRDVIGLAVTPLSRGCV